MGNESSEQSGATVKIDGLLCFASDAALALDDKLRIVGWNRGAERLLGYRADEVSGRPCREVIQAVLPGGEPLCGPGCPAGFCFFHQQPFAIKVCHARHRNGHWIPISIGSIVNPHAGHNSGECVPAAILLLRNSALSTDALFPESILRIFTFGRFGIVAGNKALAVESWTRKQALTLVKYLVTHSGKEVHRERLMECLWPGEDEDRARDRLKVVMYFLRHQIRRAGVKKEIITTTSKGYALCRGTVWVDAEHFHQLAKEGVFLERRNERDKALRCYQEARFLYRGDYLEEDVYADWCAQEREHLRESFLDVLVRIARICIEQGRVSEAMEACREALVREPCRESFHRMLMTCMARSGHYDEALAQYRRCVSILARELGVAPMPETQHLYQDIHARTTSITHARKTVEKQNPQHWIDGYEDGLPDR